MTTPFHVSLDTTNGLPPHVEAIYQNNDPSVPDVVRVTVPAVSARTLFRSGAHTSR